MGTTIPSFLQWVLHHACAWAGQTDFYIKAELRARRQQLEVGRWRGRLGGEVGGGGGRGAVGRGRREGGEEKRRRRRRAELSIEPKGR